MREAKEILESLNTLSEVKVTPMDVMKAKERFEEQVKETTWLAQRVSVYGSNELQARAWNNLTAQLKAMDAFLEGLYNESVGE
jgi:hypothetical protein